MTDQHSGRDQYLDSFKQASASPGPTAEPHGIDGASRSGVPGRDFAPGESASGRSNLDASAFAGSLPGQADNVLGPPARNESNLGLQRPTMPDMQFVVGAISAADFQRGPLTQGHARPSPGDGWQDGGVGHRAFYSDVSGKEAEVEEASLGSGILPTPAVMYRPDVLTAEDSARGFGEHVPGQQDASPGNPISRGPMRAEQALGLDAIRTRNDYMQSDLQPSPMRGNDFPETAGREGNPNGDMAQHQVVKPVIDVAPSLGADTTGIAKSEFAKKVE